MSVAIKVLSGAGGLSAYPGNQQAVTAAVTVDGHTHIVTVLANQSDSPDLIRLALVREHAEIRRREQDQQLWRDKLAQVNQ